MILKDKFLSQCASDIKINVCLSLPVADSF